MKIRLLITFVIIASIFTFWFVIWSDTNQINANIEYRWSCESLWLLPAYNYQYSWFLWAMPHQCKILSNKQDCTNLYEWTYSWEYCLIDIVIYKNHQMFCEENWWTLSLDLLFCELEQASKTECKSFGWDYMNGGM